MRVWRTAGSNFVSQRIPLIGIGCEESFGFRGSYECLMRWKFWIAWSQTVFVNLCKRTYRWNMTFSVLRLSEEKSNLMFCLRRNQLVLVFEQWLKHLFFKFCLCWVCECACVPIHNSYFVGNLSPPVTYTYATQGRMHDLSLSLSISLSRDSIETTD